MIKYGLDQIDELIFTSFHVLIERRDDQWIDVTLTPQLSSSSAPIPDDLTEFSILVICNHVGAIAQMVPQDIGCDCEYQLTFSEKEQVRSFIESIEGRIIAASEQAL